jgi:TolB-like protein/tRNA A-37 threonylcarbamoyl transferase component Bud32/Flp pilus assembly protein TadD
MPVSSGSRLGPYVILSPLGAGGMGEVYRALDTRLERTVAIKVLPAHLSNDPSLQQRFLREARTISALQHPHICTLFDVGSQDGTDYLVMEYLEGESLAERLAKGPLPSDQALQTAMEIADALGQAHRQGIIHRDLKPGNIMLTNAGAKLMDFGLAKLLEKNAASGDNFPTLSGTVTSIVGTAAYMSPEQALGQAVDQRSDLFSFGIVLFEMLTGRHPWKKAAVVDIVHAIIHDDPPAFLSANPSCEDIEKIIRRTLEKNAADRYDSVSGLLVDLRGIGGRPGTLAAPTAVQEEKSIAVLPFVFLTPMEEKESLSLGFADALITTLGRLEGLRVPPTAAILKYAAGSDPLQIGRELRVQYVLQGNIQKLGGHWRVSIQLLDTQVRKTVLSEKFDFNLDDVFEIQDEIGKQVAESLQRRFHANVRKSRDRYSSDPRAYGVYLQGLDASYSETLGDLDEAIRCFTAAIARDPDFALAHAMLAHASAARYFGYEARYKSLQLAERHCERALQLDPELPEAIMARAYILWTPHRNFRHQEAVNDLKKAIAMQPNLDHAYNRLGTILAHTGQIQQALEAYKVARRINPQNLGHYNIVQAYIWGGEYEQAAGELEAFHQAKPGNKYCLWSRPQPPLLTGDLERAAKLVAEAVDAFPDEPLMLSLQGLVQAHLGQTDLARQAAAKACISPRSFGHTHHTHHQIACIHAVLADKQAAMNWLERAVDTGFPCWPFFLRDRSLSNLRGLPEFEDLITSLRSEFPSSAGSERSS